jgi:DNA mismatch repair protein MSH4
MVSVVENRSREVCLVAMSSNCVTHMEVFLLADDHSYSGSLTLLEDLGPDEILLHDGRKDSVLSKKIEMQFSGPISKARIVYISRQYFDQDKGSALLKHTLVGACDQDLLEKYTVLAASHCLLRFVENIQGFTFAKCSVRLHYRSTSERHKMTIDRQTAKVLELVSNVCDGNQKESLFGVLNKCKTKVGARFLKAQIMTPSAELETLNTRHAIIGVFLKDPQLLQQCNAIMVKLPELDCMLNGLSHEPKQQTVPAAKKTIDALIALKDTILYAARLAQIIASASIFQPQQPQQPQQQKGKKEMEEDKRSCTLLLAVLRALEDEGLHNLGALVQESFTESTKYEKSSLQMRHEECFAIASGVNGMLDMSRAAFIGKIDEIMAIAEEYERELNRQVKINITNNRGYHLKVSLTPEHDSLPPKFIQQVQSKTCISCTTLVLMSMSDRANEAITDSLRITHSLLQGILAKVRENAETLFAMVDAVALLDMLGSLAHVASSHTAASGGLPFVKPELTDHPNAPLLIQAGRHPVITCLAAQKRSGPGFVSNDTMLSPQQHSFLCISGPNGSGKTVYLKQVALLVVMAQIGSYLPCKSASIPLRDRLLSRMGSADDMENNLSTFQLEMRDNAYILFNLTSRSLVVIDELGRGTSNQDGLAIAWAVAEKLAQSPALTLFVTHYPQLAQLATMYSNVHNIHLVAVFNVAGQGQGQEQGQGQGQGAFSDVHMLHKVADGPSDLVSGYGIELAAQVGLPESIIKSARAISVVVKDEFPLFLRVQECEHTASQIAQTLSHLLLLKNSKLDDKALRVYLTELRSRIDDETSTCILGLLDREDANHTSTTNLSNTLNQLTPAKRRAIDDDETGLSKHNHNLY